MKMEPIVSSETSVIRTQTAGNYPKRNKLQDFCNSQKFLTAPMAHPTYYSVTTLSPLTIIHWQERVREYLFPSSAENFECV